jgi:hypothetical protein
MFKYLNYISVINLFVVVAFVSGCSTNVKLTPKVSENQKLIFQDGREALVSEKKHVVTIAPLETFFKHSGRAKFIVAIKNQMKDDLLFSTANLSAKYKIIKTSPSNTSNVKNSPFAGMAKFFGVAKAEASMENSEENSINQSSVVNIENLKVLSYEELLKEEKDKQASQAFAAALSSVGRSMQAANAGRSYNSGTYSGYGNSYGGQQYNTFGSYSGYTYNAAAAQAAQSAVRAETSDDFARISAEGKLNEAQLARTILKKQTVSAGQWYGGTVVISMPNPSETRIPVAVNVELNSEIHKFNYDYQKVEK